LGFGFETENPSAICSALVEYAMHSIGQAFHGAGLKLGTTTTLDHLPMIDAQ